MAIEAEARAITSAQGILEGGEEAPRAGQSGHHEAQFAQQDVDATQRWAPISS